MTMHDLGWYYKINENEKTMQCMQSQAFKQDAKNQIIMELIKPHYKCIEY